MKTHFKKVFWLFGKKGLQAVFGYVVGLIVVLFAIGFVFVLVQYFKSGSVSILRGTSVTDEFVSRLNIPMDPSEPSPIITQRSSPGAPVLGAQAISGTAGTACVQEVDKLMSAAVYLKDKWRSSGAGNCGQYAWLVYKTAKERFNLAGVDWPQWGPHNIRSNKIVIQAASFNQNMLKPGDIVLYSKNGCDHINIVGTPAEPGKFYDIDFYTPSYDPKTTKYRYPDYFDTACKSGTRYRQGLVRVYRVIPACIAETRGS